MRGLAAVLGLLIVCTAIAEGANKGGDDKKPPGGDGKDGMGGGKDDGPSKEINVGGAYMKAAGKSGKIMFWRERDDSMTTGSNSTEPKKTPPIFVVIDGVDEIKADLTAIAEDKDSGKHKKKFKDVDFTLSDKKTGSIPSTSPSATADFVEMTATFNSGKTIKLIVYVATSTGNLTIGDESTEIAEGNIKFSMELSSWPFCDAATCDGDVGEYVDVTVAVGIPPGRKAAKKNKEAKKGQKFDLGDNAFLDFSTKVQIDGSSTWTNMPAGYPKLDESDPKRTLIMLRFPKFNNTILYDPVGDSGDVYQLIEDLPDTDDYDPTGSENTSGAEGLVFSLLATTIMALMSLILHR